MKQSLEYTFRSSDIRKLEFLVDEICDKYRLNDTYFGNILMALMSAVNLIEESDKELEGANLIIDVSKERNLLIFDIKSEQIALNFIAQFEKNDNELIEDKEMEALFLIKALCDKVNISDEAIQLIFDLGRVLEPALLKRKEEFEKYYNGKRIEV